MIGPKEHMLLYNKLIVLRPTREYKPTGEMEDHYNVPRTDWAALTNLSKAMLMDTFTYAYRKGFLELTAPTHELLSLRHLSCRNKSVWKSISVWATCTLCVSIYFGAGNLESLEAYHYPWYVG